MATTTTTTTTTTAATVTSQNTTTTTTSSRSSSSNAVANKKSSSSNLQSGGGSYQKNKILFEGDVYDLTNFPHPGGSIIRAAYHCDATFIIHSYHPSVEQVRRAIQPYKLEVTNSKTTSSSSSSSELYKAPLYEELKRRVHKALNLKQANANSSTGADWLLRMKMIGLLLCYIGCFGWLATSTNTDLGQIRYAAMGLGASLALVGMNVVHDASHMATECGSWTAWNYAWQFSGELIGLSSLGWTHLHGMQHHIQTDNLWDPDVTYIYPILRSLEEQPHLPIHYIQTLFLVPLMLVFVLVFQTFVALFVVTGTYPYHTWEHELQEDTEEKIGDSDATPQPQPQQRPLLWRNQHNTKEWLQFGLSKFCLFSQWGMLYYKGGLEAWILCVTTSSFIFASIDVPGHTTVHPTLSTTSQDKLPPSIQQGDIVDNWLLEQLHHTNSFDPHLNGILGGLNLQIEHHLFPRISHRHYPTIRTILQEFCQQNNLPYNDYSLVGATLSTIQRFAQLSFPPTSTSKPTTTTTTTTATATTKEKIM